MAKKGIDYLGYDPAIIDAWRDILLKVANGDNMDTLFNFLMTIRRRHRRVVAAMITLARWIHVDDKRMADCRCPLCAVSGRELFGGIEINCRMCPFKETFGQETSCIDSIEDGKAAEHANEIYIAEYKKAFGTGMY